MAQMNPQHVIAKKGEFAKLFPKTMDLPTNALSIQPNTTTANILIDFVEPFSPIGAARRNFESDLKI